MGMRKGSVSTTCVLLALVSWAGGACVAAQTPTAPPSPPANAQPAGKAPKPAANDSDYSFDEPGATAKCRDGTYYHGRPKQSACSRHQGVEKWGEIHGDR